MIWFYKVKSFVLAKKNHENLELQLKLERFYGLNNPTVQKNMLYYTPW